MVHPSFISIHSSARLGSVSDSFTTSPSGSSPDLRRKLATTQLIAVTEVMLCGGHKAPKRNRLWLAAWLVPVCPVTAGVSSAQLTQAVAWAGCSALKTPPHPTINPKSKPKTPFSTTPQKPGDKNHSPFFSIPSAICKNYNHSLVRPHATLQS
jgi:hypothetical protein